MSNNESTTSNEPLRDEKTTPAQPEIPPEQVQALRNLAKKMQNPLVLAAMQQAMEATLRAEKEEG